MSPTFVDGQEVVRLSAELERRSPEEILQWTSDQFGERLGISTAFGVGGSVLLDMAHRLGLKVRVFTLDTRCLFDETHAMRRAVEERYGIHIEVCEPALTEAEIEAKHGTDLARRDPDRCCLIRKVEPMRGMLAQLDCWVSGVRRDQGGGRQDTPVLQRIGAAEGRPVLKCHPLVRWTKREVWTHILNNEVPYHPLLDRGYGSVGCEPCTTPLQPGEGERDGRWRGRAKTECGIHTRVGNE